jgi:amidase
MDHFNLDAIIGSLNRGLMTMAAQSGSPCISVPAGFSNRYLDSTASYNFKELSSKMQPVGIIFAGLPYSEPKLIKYAYAYEQATKNRRPPTYSKEIGQLVYPASISLSSLN